MKSSDKYFIIPFVGLKIGTHEFEFEINDSFFEDMEYSIVQKGKIKVILQLEKKETMFNARFFAEGTIETVCDRCNAPLELDIEGEFSLVYKFGYEESEDESLVILHPEAYELNVKDAIYELISTSVPPRVLHQPGECDEEMWSLLKQYTVNQPEEEEDDDDWDDDEEEQIPGIEEFDPKDPKWSILKNLN